MIKIYFKNMTCYTSLKYDYKYCTSIILYTPEIYLAYSTLRNVVLLSSLSEYRKTDWASYRCHVFIYGTFRYECL
jgi:hypothetical protein